MRLFCRAAAATPLIGNPPPEVAKELQRLWAAEWRQR